MSINLKNWFFGKKWFTPHTKKSLVWGVIAAIVFIGLFVIFFFRLTVLKNTAITASLFNTLKSTETVANNQDEGILGGPFESGDGPISDDFSFFNQANIDFSADDEIENIDFSMMQENSIIASTNPSLINPFTGTNKQVIAYVVRNGDNPEKIAVSFGINTNTLLWANNLKNGDLIRPGNELIILPINGVRHKVQSGDTIVGLAKKYQADSEEISQFNSLLSNNDLQKGAYIIIPDGEMPSLPKPKISAPKFSSYATAPISWLIMPTTGRNWGRLHGFRGVDIANQCGTPIYSAAAGRVILVDVIGWNGGYGKNIRIQHQNGVVTLYAHLSQSLVESGQEVSQGQLIGLMGSTGRSTGCHVHFEVRGAKNPFVWR